ncbi:HAMP domain-containing sensor histidine kinase [Tenacibaculum sp. 190524A05c]|uniref:histidine kinase n=1 Tax=Tenacibaculum platacis TaxID=3137852 RepID=A0ABM9NXV4_9FLAO
MSRKIILLIIASIIGLIALSYIQARLIKNTYSLRKEAFTDNASNTVSKIGSYGSPIDSIFDAISDTFVKDLDRYNLNKISSEQLLNRLQTISDSLNPRFIKEYEKEIDFKDLGYNLKYHRQLKNLVILDSLKTDTIFKRKKREKGLKLIGYDFESNSDLHLGTSTWETNRTFEEINEGKTEKISYHIVFETSNYINIDDWEKIILNEMRSLLIFSFCIFLFVIGLFYYSIKNLITQKKIADIKTDFVNNITHELKTPLSTLALATKILKKEEHQSPMIVSTIGTIERQNIRLQKLIDQVLNNSLGYKELSLEKQPVQSVDFISEILNDFEVSHKEEVSLGKSISTKNLELSIDKFYTTTAIVNILENAVKYGANKIEVATKNDRDYWKIKIKDNGIGISKKNQKLVFNKFYRAENKDVHNVKGLGLGLYYSHQIIKAHNGSIKVESEKGKGTTFTIALPLK